MVNILEKFWLDRDKAVLAVIDVQQKLVPTMPQDVYRRVLKSIEFLVKSAGELAIPVVVTEQYPRGLGATVPELSGVGVGGVVEKVSFGCCGDPEFMTRLKSLGRTQVVVTGMEAHVCVYQTVLGLLEAGYHVHLVRDGIIARGETDYLNALNLAQQAGAVVTTSETAVFQLLRGSTSPGFKKISGLVKERFAGEP